MAGVIRSGTNTGSYPNNFGASDAVTASQLNGHVNDASFDPTAVVTGGGLALDTGIKIADEGVTLARMAHVDTNKILGRTTAGTGDVEALTLNTDNALASASATSLATDGSIKAYVDTYIRPNIVTTNSTAASNVSATTDWTDFPSLEVTITPRLASSKFIIDAHGLLGNASNQMIFGKIQYKVNSGSYADVVIADSPSNRTNVHGILDMDLNNDEWGGGLIIHIGASGLSYSVGAGDTITFKLQVKNYFNSLALYFNRTENDADTARKFRGVSTITVQEV
jgi:hypothetical protein